MLGITTTNARVGGFRGGISADAKTIYNRIIADGGVSNLSRLNFFVKGLKAIYGDLANVPVCYDAHWIGYKLGSGTGATAGQAAAKLYSLTVAGDAVQATAASQPLLLSHNGSDNYWWGSKVASNYCSTPYNASKTFVDDFEIIAYDINPFLYASDNNIIGKFTGITTRQFIFGITATGGLYLGVSIDGINTISYLSTANIPTAGNTFSVKITRDKINGLVKFFTSIDSGANFTQLGANVSSITSSLFNANTDLLIGAYLGGSGGNFGGKIKRVTIANSIGGTPVVDFNPATYNAATSQTAWTSATGEIWTISTGTATSGYKGVLVDRTIVQGDGVDDEMSSSAFALNQPNTSYLAFSKYSSVTKTVVDGLVNDTRNIIAYANVIRHYAGGVLDISFVATNDVIMDTWVNNGASSLARINNGTATNGNSGASNASGVHLFKGGNTTANSKLTTLVYSNINDSTLNQTATYNLIRSLNNNAF
jgi:hypothetical protein